MKTSLKFILALTAIIITGCSEDDSEQPLGNHPIPTITTFSPAYGLPGADIIVTGTNFATESLTANTIRFNGIDAIITTANKTQLHVTVPTGASTGKITVKVNGQVATSPDDFEVLQDIPRNGLVAFYPFTGNAHDESGNSLNGIITEAVPANDRFGKPGQAYSFDGVDDFITMGNPPLLQISNKITIAGWIKINAFRTPASPGNAMTIISKLYHDPDAGGNPTKGYRIVQNFTGDGTPLFATYLYAAVGSTVSSYTGAYLGGPDALTTDNWIFFALVIDDEHLEFYKNNAATPNDDITGSADLMDDGSLANLNIGKLSSNDFFNGFIDDVTLYNRKLNAAEIQQLYQQTVTKY